MEGIQNNVKCDVICLSLSSLSLSLSIQLASSCNQLPTWISTLGVDNCFHLGPHETPQIGCGSGEFRDDSPEGYELLGWCHLFYPTEHAYR
jgi:hypothetical protein